MTGAVSTTNIIEQLKKDLLRLQGFKPATSNRSINNGLAEILYAFPQQCFPLGAIHEFITAQKEDISATTGFIAGLLSTLLKIQGVLLWIAPANTIYPPALKRFGIAPEHIIFIHLHNRKDMLWVMEEALKCDALTAVVTELTELNFTESRRLQLAVEKTKVTGFIIRKKISQLQTNACIARWRITSLPAISKEALPGVGHPQWQIDLLKIRNGKPGSWQLSWNGNRFVHTRKTEAPIRTLQKTA